MAETAVRTIAEAEVGDFVAELLVTDTRVYEVVRRTAKTLTLRTTRETDRTRRDGEEGAYGLRVVYTEVEADPEGRTFTVRLRKDGTYRYADYTRPLYLVEGTPEARRDWRF